MNNAKKNSRLDLVKAQSALKREERLNTTITELRDKIVELGSLNNLIHEPSLVLHICQLVENITRVKLSGSEKKQLVIQLITESIPQLNNENDMHKIGKLIDFLCECDLIKKVAETKVVAKSVFNFLKAVL